MDSIGSEKMTRSRRHFGMWVVAAAALASCPEDGAEDALLIARPAGIQPDEDSSGITVIIQATGGDRLAVRTEKGRHAFQPSAQRRETSCVPLAAGRLTLLELQVFPEADEPLMFVDLRQSGGAADAGLDDSCAGETLRTVVVALRGKALPPDAGEEGEAADAQ
jgi:hypothetical protein